MLVLSTHRILLCLLLISANFSLYSHKPNPSWAEKTLGQMTLEEKVAQLMMISLNTTDQNSNLESVLNLLDKFPIGGILFMKGTLENQRKAYKLLQKRAKISLLTAQDDEWGLSMRLSDAMRFPRNLTLGALQDTSLIEKLGELVGLQCRASGVYLNFAPVVDINSNPKNPVISDRSFGEDPNEVTTRALLWLKGFKKSGLLACAKHFPGHGDTAIDSHLSLPIIKKTIHDLKSIEWKPFQALINAGVDSVMTAHLLMPSISDLPSSVCEKSVTSILKNQMHFDGLVFTDSMQMQAISSIANPSSSDLMALKAGNDMIVAPKNFHEALLSIIEGYQQGKITSKEIDEKVLKILRAKEALSLNKNPPLENIDFFSKEAKELKRDLFQKAITLYPQNSYSCILDCSKKTAFVQIGRDVTMKDALELVYAPYEQQLPSLETPFLQRLKQSIAIDNFFIPKACGEEELGKVINKLQGYAQIIVGVYEMNKFHHKNFGITPSTLQFFEKVDRKKVFLALFGSPYSLKYFKGEKMILMGYENDPDVQTGCAEIFLGQKKALGRLPITIEN